MNKTMERASVNFKQVVLGLLVVLVPVACRFENTFTRQIRCCCSTLIVKYRFEKPFKGMVYAKDNLFDWNCSFRPRSQSNVHEVSLYLPFDSCGTNIQFVPGGNYTISNKIVIQQHNVLKTSEDIEEDVSCLVSELSQWVIANLLKSENKTGGVASPKITSTLELKLGHEVLGSKLALERRVFNEQLLVFKVPSSGRYIDIHIKNCMLHGDLILDDHSKFYQLTHPSGCQNTSSDLISEFSVINKTETGELLAYAKIKPLKALGETELYISCGAQLCKRTCRRRCGKGKSARDTLSTVATHRISKRSTDANLDQGARKKSDTRNRFLKSTIKALSERLMKKVEEQKQQNDTLFKKRVFDNVEKENSTALDGIEDSEGSSVTNSDAISNTISPMDYEIVILNVVNDTDDDEPFNDTDDAIAHLEEYDDQPTATTFPDNFPQAKSDDQNHDLKFIKTLSSITSQYKKLSLQNEALKKRLVKKGSSKLSRSADSESSTWVTITSDVELSTSFNRQTLSSREESTSMEQFTDDVEELPATTTLSTSSTPEDSDVTSIALTEISEPNLVTEVPVKSQNESVVEGYSIKLDVGSAEPGLDYKSSLNGSCVPQLTFLAVSIGLGFIVFVLLMICCGLALYIRKEKKRHLIDNFLLYNFY